MIRRWLGAPDRKAISVFVGSAVFLVLLLGVLPRWLHTREAQDLTGAAVQTAPGAVQIVQISPVSEGGGGLFNAVTVSFAGRQGYYALPKSSRWKPKIGDDVIVTYRIGRQSGLVHVDSVTPVERSHPSPP